MNMRTLSLVALLLVGCTDEPLTSTCNLTVGGKHQAGRDLVLKAIIIQGADGGAYAITEQGCEKFGMLNIWESKRPWTDGVEAFEEALGTARRKSTVENPLGVEATMRGQLNYGRGPKAGSLGFTATDVIRHRVVPARREYERQLAEFEKWRRQSP
jgi:hypothetical protein